MHNYKCDMCEEGFLIEADLADHKVKHVNPVAENTTKDNDVRQCEECGMVFENTTDLNAHKESEHATIDDAEKQVSNEIDELREMIKKLETDLIVKDQFLELADEAFKEEKKLKVAGEKERIKIIKEHESKVKEIGEQLLGCRNEIARYVELSTKLREENHVLKALKETEEQLRNNPNPEVV